MFGMGTQGCLQACVRSLQPCVAHARCLQRRGTLDVRDEVGAIVIGDELADGDAIEAIERELAAAPCGSSRLHPCTRQPCR